MRILTTYLFILVLLVGCSYVGWDETRIPVDFQAKQFNRLASEYMDRPTFAQLTTFKNGAEKLDVRMDPYGDGNVYYQQKYFDVTFTSDHMDEYVALINKYLEWETRARTDGDIFTKEIGKVKSFATPITFTFYSGNEYSHFLELSHLGTNEQYYDRASALLLKEFLQKYQAGEFQQLDTDKKYQ